MRLSALAILAFFSATACKTTRENRSTTKSLETLENQDQLPECDDITTGRSYWVRSMNAEMICAEGGTWQLRHAEAQEPMR